jgi:antitoxin component YwqK of YwqJK toxin-antitoxin module
MRRLKSDIAPDAFERVIEEYREQGQLIYFRVTECILNGEVVGRRAYDGQGTLRHETPLKNGKKHGREYVWGDQGILESVEPYVDGQLHGLAKQYNRRGKIIGTYRFVHGDGYDIWRHEREDGSIGVSEVFSVKDTALHGYEWWLRDDQRSVSHERHWQKGQVHGIERMWNHKGNLKRGYPKYWIQGQAVSKRGYLKAAAQDKTLPQYREKDNRPQRRFPDDIEKLLRK